MNVLDFGAIGDGVADDTAILQACLDAHEKLEFPEGSIFKINGNGLKINSGKRLKMYGATLKSSINLAPFTRVLSTIPGSEDIEIEGGEIIGSRDVIVGCKWGKGLEINSSKNVIVRRLKISENFFDGLWIGGNSPSVNILIEEVICSYNRRNGLSIVNAIGVRVYRSTFSFTSGQDPQSGVDIEPNKNEEVIDVIFVDCQFEGNRGNGLYMHKGQGNPGTNYAVLYCNFEYNTNFQIIGNSMASMKVVGCDFLGGAKGASFGVECSDLLFVGNKISGSIGNALTLAAVKNPIVAGNTISGVVQIVPVGDKQGVYGRLFGEI